jgi:hypothetical protein
VMTDSERPQKQYVFEEATTTKHCPSNSCIWKESHNDEQTETTSISDVSRAEPTSSTTRNGTGTSYCSIGSTTIQTPVRTILELGIIPDCGALPLWLNDTLGSRTPTTANKFRKYLSTPLDDVEERTKTWSCVTKTANCQESTLRAPRAKTSALAAAFLKKVDQSWKQALVPHSKDVPSLRIVKSVKGRWPPQASRESSTINDYGGEAKAKSQTSVMDINSTVSTKELLEAFENGNFRQTTDLSTTAIKEAASNRAKEESLLSPVSVKQRQRSFENNGTTPLHTSIQRTWRRCQSEHAITTSGRGAVGSPNPLDDHDNSTLSSRTAESSNLRSSYKIQYLGKREWGSGYVDSTFPTLVQRVVDASEVFPRDADFCDSSKHRSGVVNVGNSTNYDISNVRDVALSDQRFDVSSSIDAYMPALPHRSRDVYIPTIWQTRASDVVDGNTTGWRLKRVWVHSQDRSRVIEDGEPDYYVDESDLESALNSLLGIYVCFDINRSVDVNSIVTSSESNSSEFSNVEFAKNRWGTSEGNKDPLLKKPWRVQRVWDRDGVICCVDDERTVDGASLLEILSMDDDTTMDSLAVNRPKPGALDPEQGTFRLNDDVITESDTVGNDDQYSYTPSCFSEGSEDDGVAKEEGFEANLEVAWTNSHDEGDVRSLKLIRRKLRKVEKLIHGLSEQEGSKTTERNLSLRLQLKRQQYLNELSHEVKEMHGKQRSILGGLSPDPVPGKISVSAQQGRHSQDMFKSDGCKWGQQSQNDSTNGSEAIKHRSAIRELCTEKQLLHNVPENTRKDFTKAILPVGPPLEINPERISERNPSSVVSPSELPCTSSQSKPSTSKNLDVIFEDERTGGPDSDDCRDNSLYDRKIQKVKREMQNILKKTGEKGKTKKLYLRLKEKLALYQSEINGNNLHHNRATYAKGREGNGVPKRVEEPISVMQMTFDETDEEKRTGGAQFASQELQRSSFQSLGMERLPPLACANAGRWSSPFVTGEDDMKLIIHSLESVYT